MITPIRLTPKGLASGSREAKVEGNRKNEILRYFMGRRINTAKQPLLPVVE